MRKKFLVLNSQDIKTLTKVDFFSVFFLVIMQLLNGCSTATRAPSPTTQEPVSSPHLRLIESFDKVPQKIDSNYTQSQASYHFSLAQSLSLEGNADRAIEEYKVALIYDPQSAVIHTRLATEYVKKGLLTFAIEECKIAVKLDGQYTDARLLLGGLYSSTKLVREALEQYDAVLKFDSKNSEAYVFKGSLLLEEGRAQDAVSVLKKLIEKDPDYFLGYYYLGKAYQKLSSEAPPAKAENIEKLVIENFKKALEVKPNFSQAGLTLGLFYEEKKKIKEAMSVYESLYENSGDMQAVARLAQLSIDAEKYDAALKYLLLLNRADDDNLNVKVKIGLLYIEQKKFAEAAETFRSILDKNPDSDRVRYYLASIYEEQKLYDDAISEFKRIPIGSSSYPDAVVHVANLYKLKGELREGLAYIDQAAQEATKKDLKLSQFHIFKASLLEEDKRFDQAVIEMLNAKKEFPRDERVLYYLGSIYDKLGKFDEALSVMNEILVLNPDNVQALNYIGYTYASKAMNIKKAEEYIRRAVHLKPGDAYIQDSFGYVLLIKGDVHQATIELEKAWRLKPDEAVIVEHLGDAYLKNNLKQKALQKYLEAAKLYSDPQDRQKLEKKINAIDPQLSKNRSAAGRF